MRQVRAPQHFQQTPANVSGARANASEACASPAHLCCAVLMKHEEQVIQTKGMTPLMAAVASGHYEIAKLLLENGADHSAKNESVCETQLRAALNYPSLNPVDRGARSCWPHPVPPGRLAEPPAAVRAAARPRWCASSPPFLPNVRG